MVILDQVDYGKQRMDKIFLVIVKKKDFLIEDHQTYGRITCCIHTTMVRLKNRWLLFEITYDSTCPPDLNLRDISSAVKESIGFNFGDIGLGSVLSSISGKR